MITAALMHEGDVTRFSGQEGRAELRSDAFGPFLTLPLFSLVARAAPGNIATSSKQTRGQHFSVTKAPFLRKSALFFITSGDSLLILKSNFYSSACSPGRK